MNAELENKLYDIDPVFFEQAIACKNGTMNEMNTCMAFGCECGDGWFENICNLAKKTSLLNKIGKQHNIKFVCNQLKEKWGGCRIYTSAYPIEQNKPIGDDAKVLQQMFDSAVEQCTTSCSNVCEFCGAKGGINGQKLVTTHGWIHKICIDCSQKMMIEDTKKYDKLNNKEYVPRITLFKEGFYFLNMFYPCYFEYDGESYKSIIQAYIAKKDPQHNYIYTMLRHKLNPSSFMNYTIFKAFGGNILEEDYDLIKDITYSRFNYSLNREDLSYLLKTQGYLLSNMGNHCDNIYGHCVCDKCKNLKHKDLYAKILTDVRDQLIEQNNKKRDDLCWKNGEYYLRDEKGQLIKQSILDAIKYQNLHHIKDQEIKVLI